MIGFGFYDIKSNLVAVIGRYIIHSNVRAYFIDETVTNTYIIVFFLIRVESVGLDIRLHIVCTARESR